MPRELTALAHRCLDLEDDVAWSDFARRLEQILTRFLCRRLTACGQRWDRELLEELRQEVFCRLLESRCSALARCRAVNDHQLLAYLKVICNSVVGDRHRRRATVKRTVDSRASSISEVNELAEVWPDPAPDPEQRLLRRESRDHLRRCCRSVVTGPNAERNLAIFELAIVHGWSSREIRDLGYPELSVTGIDSIVHRLRRRLRRLGIEVPVRRTPRSRANEKNDS